MTLPRYPSYKDSGVEWLGEVPGHWEVKTLKRLAKLTTGMTPPTDDPENYSDDDQLQWIRPEDLDETGAPTSATKFLSKKGWEQARQIKAGATLICCIGTIGKLGFIAEDASTNQQLTAAEFERSNRYFFFAMCAGRTPFEVASTGNVLRILNTERLGNIPFPCPSEVEATQIATFLDRETAKIDALVAEQRRLMALLKEKRQAVISHAVTRGLNPDAPLKPSGIEWLGDVPAHWLVTPLGILADQIQTGPFGSQLHSSDYIDDGTPVINPSNIQGGKLIADSSCTVDLKIVERLSQHKLELGDIVFGRRGEMGRCAMVTEESIGWLCGTGSLNVRLSSKITPSFVSTYLGTDYVRELLQLESVGSTMDNLNTQILSGIPVPTPPLKEQQQISQYLAMQTDRFDTLTTAAQRAIDLLQERRTALISAAITGQIDVRSAVAS